MIVDRGMSGLLEEQAAFEIQVALPQRLKPG
jgi:hypothetical protein